MAQQGSEQQSREVEVSAGGSAWVVPDQVSISLGVEVPAPTVGEAVEGASRAVADLVAGLDAGGVPPDRRRTTGLFVQQQWAGEGRPAAHEARYVLDVVVATLDGAGRLVQDLAERVGDALRVHQFQLGAADVRPQQAQARADAVRACREQAEQLAAAADARLGDLLHLREGGGQNGMVLESGRMSKSMHVEGGQLEVTVVVTARWHLVV